MKIRQLLSCIVLILCGTASVNTFGAELVSMPSKPGGGVLRVHPSNPRYFTDDSGKAIYMTGSHAWWNIVTEGGRNAPFTESDFEDFIYFSVMFFGSFNGFRTSADWKTVAWHPSNNINRALADAFDQENGNSFFTTDPAALAIQRLLVRRMIDTLKTNCDLCGHRRCIHRSCVELCRLDVPVTLEMVMLPATTPSVAFYVIARS